MVDQNAAAATALRLIDADGRKVSLSRRNTSAPNSSTPWKATTVAAPTAASGGDTIDGVTVAFVPATGSGFGRDIFRSPEMIKRINQIGLLAGSATTKDVEGMDTLTDADGRVYEVLEVGTFKPGNVVLLYFLGLKG